MRTLFGAADGVAYRFKLPLVGPPPPGGDRVKVEVAYVADKNAHLLATDDPLCQHLAHQTTIFDNVQVVQLVLDDVLWLLPMRKKGNGNLTLSSVTANRWSLQHCEQRALQAPPSMPSPRRKESLYYRDSWEDFRPRWDILYAAPYSRRSRIPPPSGYGPLSSRTSQDSNVVAQIPDYADRDDESEEEWDDLTIEEELPINVATKRPINFIRYVDFLPRGDSFPPDARLIDRRLAHNEIWRIDYDMKTCFLATRTEPGKRMREWQLLTDPDLGLPGEVHGDEFRFPLGKVAISRYIEDHPFDSGPALLKLVPKSKDWACQPTSASPTASYILNNWRVVVEQDGVQHDFYDVFAEYIDFDDHHDFELLAELASAEGGPGRIIYGQRPYWYGEKISGVGIRLRDGGSRFELSMTDDGKLHFELPADRHLHSKWGRFDHEKIEPELYPDMPVAAELRVGCDDQPHDVLFRVNSSEVGDFKRLDYVVLHRYRHSAIEEHEWRSVDQHMLDEWVVCLFLNIAKVTWGCRIRDLVRPTTSPSSNAGSSSAVAPTRSGDVQSMDSTGEDDQKGRKKLRLA